MWFTLKSVLQWTCLKLGGEHVRPRGHFSAASGGPHLATPLNLRDVVA